jgi:hypothetical protein
MGWPLGFPLIHSIALKRLDFPEFTYHFHSELVAPVDEPVGRC